MKHKNSRQRSYKRGDGTRSKGEERKRGGTLYVRSTQGSFRSPNEIESRLYYRGSSRFGKGAKLGSAVRKSDILALRAALRRVGFTYESDVSLGPITPTIVKELSN